MAENRTLNDRYVELGQALVDGEPLLAPIRDSSVTICYLGSDYAKRSKLNEGRFSDLRSTQGACLCHG